MVQIQSDMTAGRITECVERFRMRRPHVHCITNSVAQNFTANVLLAAGARASMTIAKDEIVDFVTMADALLINLGTMDAERSLAIELAVETANKQGKPWALDPVFVQVSPIRLKLAHQLMSKSPDLVRCNVVEASSLFATDSINEGLMNYTKQHSVTIALTGRIDRVFAVGNCVEIANGDPLMDKVTAVGCALTALTVGFLSVEDDHHLAAISALAFYGLAGEVAARKSEGPGTFVPHFLDELANLSEAEILDGVDFQ